MINKMDLIKKLREITQAGVTDCNKALSENNNDLDKSIEWLRTKGIAKAAKKADAIAAEGVAIVCESGNKALILELNCQTDFVATNTAFLDLANKIKEIIISKNIKNVEEALETKLDDGRSIKLACDELTGRIGEKISLRRFDIVTKQDNETFGIYQHANNRISTLVVVDTKVDKDVSKNVAMHAAAMAPKFLNKTKVNQQWLENETKILTEQTVAEGKPREFADKIVKGRIQKLLAENCLEDQAYVKDPSMTVATYIKNYKGNLTNLIRFEVGEGIERKEVDFAAEVAEQMNAK